MLSLYGTQNIAAPKSTYMINPDSTWLLNKVKCFFSERKWFIFSAYLAKLKPKQTQLSTKFKYGETFILKYNLILSVLWLRLKKGSRAHLTRNAGEEIMREFSFDRLSPVTLIYKVTLTFKHSSHKSKVKIDSNPEVFLVGSWSKLTNDKKDLLETVKSQNSSVSL